MRIYYDWEFVDTGREILPISLGMEADNGDHMYRINNSQPVISRAFSDPWLADNVMAHLPIDRLNDTWVWRTHHPDMYAVRDIAQIAQDVRYFITSHGPGVELWSWCGAYDHVVLSQLFGRMVDAPEGFPHHTKDLQQEIDRLGLRTREDLLPKPDPNSPHNALADARWHRRVGQFLLDFESNQAEYPPDYGR